MNADRCRLTRLNAAHHGHAMVEQAAVRTRICTRLDPDSETLLGRWATAMRAEGKSRNTVTLRMSALRLAAASAGCRVDELSVDDLRVWLAGQTNPNTRITYYGSAVRFHGWLVAERLREANPMENIKRPPRPRGRPRPCPSAHLAAVLLAAKPRDRDMIMLGAYQGLRRAEIARVRGEDVDLDTRTITIFGKGDSVDPLPMHERVAEIALRMPRTGPWFPSPYRPGESVRPGAVWAAVRRSCEAAGVRFSPHQLRHWYGSTMHREGADIRTVQTLLRHASLETTQIYVGVEASTQRAALERLPMWGGHP